MIKVGITGGIGSGKTMVCRTLEILGYHVYYADDRAKILINSKDQLKEKLINRFGADIYLISGNIDREKLASLIFHNKENLQFVNGLIHPAVMEDFIAWIQKNDGTDIVFQEAALIFESGIYKMLDFTISVICPEDIRINRVVKRDGVKPDSVIARIKNQMSDEDRISLSDFIIMNDEKQLIIPQLNTILNKIKDSIV